LIFNSLHEIKAYEQTENHVTKQEAIRIFFESIRVAYIKDQRDKKIRASGKSAELFRTEATDVLGRLFGADYVYFQKKGRRPSSTLPPIESIIQWIKDKGVFNVDDKSIRGLAFAIAKKIQKRGTDIYQKKRPALNIEGIITDQKKKLVATLLTIEATKIKDKLNRAKNSTSLV
jgi:hypothetical protein